MIPRDARAHLRTLLRGFRVVTLTGPRESRKTTLAKAVLPDRPNFSLEDPDMRALALGDPRAFLGRLPDGGVLDEIQRAPKLLSYLQTRIDADGWTGQFLLTGSQQFGLMPGITQSLAGARAASPTLAYGATQSFERQGVRVLGWDAVAEVFRGCPCARRRLLRPDPALFFRHPDHCRHRPMTNFSAAYPPHTGRRRRTLAAVLLAAAATVALALTAPTHAKPLRFASAFDPQSMDPHALALLYQSRVVSQIYESLVNRDRDFKLEPSLAASWKMVDARTWRFALRPNVRFHDGTPMTADDVVFSIERALAKTSQRAFQLRGVTGARKVDELIVDVQLSAPDAVLPEKLIFIGIMSKAWAEKNGVTLPQDFNAKQETYAVRNANGTGPFMLKRYEPDARLVLAAYPDWWGRGTKHGGGNVTEVTYTVIQSDATRMAALATGEADFVIDPPFQDVARLAQDKRLKFASTTDIGTQYLGFDQARAELETSDVKGRNPFKDLRVRKAVYQAIDIDSIVAKVLRGQAAATGSFVSALVDGYVAEFDRRLPYDPAAARALLKEAGYPNGFSVQLDCVNVTFRAAVCQAVSAMLAQVGIRVTFQPSPSALFFPKLTQATTSFFEFGWIPTTDPWSMLNSIVRSYDGSGAGQFNGGRYSNPKLDALIDAIRVEPDLARRRQLSGDALRLMAEDLPLLPLYRRKINWVMRPNIHVAPWPNDILELRFVRIE